MNKVVLMGRLTRDPEVRYSQSATPVAVARYGLAVKRSYVKPGEPDVDFFNIVSFGKAGEFAEKYFKKGQLVAVVGRLQVSTWEDQQKVKHTNVDVIAEEQHFAESRAAFEAQGNRSEGGAAPAPNANANTGAGAAPAPTAGFNPSNFDDDDDLPF